MKKYNVKKNLFNLRTLLYIAVFVLGGIQLFLSCSLSIYGEEIAVLSEKKEQLERENQYFENKLAELSSLSTIQARAEEELGMIHPEIEVFSSRRLAQKLEADN